jgi:hypothetical protein
MFYFSGLFYGSIHSAFNGGQQALYTGRNSMAVPLAEKITKEILKVLGIVKLAYKLTSFDLN